MFLKRIEMQGFKSFADKTVITFEHPITGIVGPNGCGKSNISDAVRWVLGEQSAKQMRGEKMYDVIFSGSADRRMLNMAEVTLVFDNTSRVLNTDQDEIEVTRRLFRDSGDAEYLINRNRVRLRDIVELFLDTGLGKDSLSIISQGNVISFAESKPLERRGIFEEAAGVAKYKKRKLESLSRLERTKNNLDRSNDILLELEKQVSPLKRQAKKAEEYRAKKKRLEEIEISVLVQDIDDLNTQIEDTKKTLFDIDTRTAMLSNSIETSENRIIEDRKRSSALDRESLSHQNDLLHTVDEITALEARKTEMDERSKYIIETGNREQKVKETRDLLEIARLEYEDREERRKTLENEIKLNSEKLSLAAQSLFDLQTEYEQAQGMLRSLENQKTYLDNLLKDPFSRQAGVKSVMDNKHSLHGILGVVGQVIKAKDGYEEAISEALGGVMYNIVTTNEEAGRNAIGFLNRNRAGKATFLPLTVLRPSWVTKEALIICENTEGYLGTASQFVDYDKTFDPVVQRELNNVLVVDTLENGNNLSALTNRSYKIVTLNGEVIHRGGAMTGGKNRRNTTLVTAEKELAEIDANIDAQKARTELAGKKLRDTQFERDAVSRTLQENRYALASLEPIVDAKKAKYDKLKNDLALLGDEPVHEEGENTSLADDTITRLNTAYSRRDELNQLLRSINEQKFTLNQEIERKEQQVRQQRKELETTVAAANAIKIDQGRLETRMDNSLQRLATEYQLTYEFARTKVTEEKLDNAREEVLQLREEIARLGNINMNAPEEYNEVNERYEFLKKQIDELTESRDKILAAIDEMDRVMTKQFKEMFDKINIEFDNIFRSLYGGGSGKLVLEDPTDILNTGIEIKAQPPGKAIQNNMLFSGGEKSLIALCVLFAILKVKPVPLVILDEVEAALDQGNVERFAQYLHHYTDRTQFVVVTHRPGTMENADVLFGVTMQHQGVSQMLKVEIRDALTYADNKPAEVNS
ncbi:MAG: AAA family ATPase [Solobacterium sp.]|nr:AAA family ATPase [Solobacterium sp.]